MATTKKKPAAKTTVTKKSVKTPTARKSTAKKTVAKKHAAAEVRSFRPSAEKTPFMTFEFTIQSVYWMIFSGLVLALGAWVMHLNVQIQSLYDSVEVLTQSNNSIVAPVADKPEAPTESPAN